MNVNFRYRIGCGSQRKGTTFVTALFISIFILLVATAGGSAQYSESPELAKQVAAGSLPPVQERLPENPMVLPVHERIGEYGGTWNQTFQGIGDLGEINQWVMYEPLISWSRDINELLKGEVAPNIATSWEFSPGAKELVIHLREGIKWSDGAPFTADDILFWWEDYINYTLDGSEPQVPKWATVGGQPMTVTKLDDYTVAFRFAQPYPLFLQQMAVRSQEWYFPKHYLVQFHPMYQEVTGTEAKELWAEFVDQLEYALNPDIPTIYAWQLSEWATGQRATYSRNPNYWKVDPEGNQLPYIDQIVRWRVENPQTAALKGLAGEVDLQSGRIPIMQQYPLFIENQERGGYTLLPWWAGHGSRPIVMLNLNHKDPVKRELFNKTPFRHALSLAIDRQLINELVWYGTGEPRQNTVHSRDSYYKPEYAQAYAKYAPERAAGILDDLGLTERDADGFRVLEDGRTLTLVISTMPTIAEWVSSLEIVKDNWEAVGIKTLINTVEPSLLQLRYFQSEHDVAVWDNVRGLVPDVDPTPYVPVAQNQQSAYAPLTALWYETGGKEGVPPPTEPMARALELYDQFVVEANAEKRRGIFEEILAIQAEQLWTIGLVGELPRPAIKTNRMHNVPSDIPRMAHLNTLGLASPPQFFIEE